MYMEAGACVPRLCICLCFSNAFVPLNAYTKQTTNKRVNKLLFMQRFRHTNAFNTSKQIFSYMHINSNQCSM